MKTDRELFLEFLVRCDINYIYYKPTNSITLTGEKESEFSIASPVFYFDEDDSFIEFMCVE